MTKRGAPSGRYLLDTHALLFVDQAPERLPTAVGAIVADARNQLFVSIASLWEIQIKVMTGKLSLTVPVDRLMLRQQRDNDIGVLPVSIAHVVEHAALPRHHGDPFDRMLVSQARVEGLVLVSADVQLQRYDVPVTW